MSSSGIREFAIGRDGAIFDGRIILYAGAAVLDCQAPLRSGIGTSENLAIFVFDFHVTHIRREDAIRDGAFVVDLEGRGSPFEVVSGGSVLTTTYRAVVLKLQVSAGEVAV